jgi:hypothetical protein
MVWVEHAAKGCHTVNGKLAEFVVAKYERSQMCLTRVNF